MTTNNIMQNSFLKFIFVLLLLGQFPSLTQAYPYEGALPTPMGSSFYQKQSNGYNSDGTLVSNPIILANNGDTITCGDSQCIQKTTTNSATNTIEFLNNNYTMYINIPTYMIISNVYSSLSSQYPSNLSSYNIFTSGSVPSKINGGNSTPLPTSASLSPYTNENVFVITANNTGNNDSYYIPNIPNIGSYHTGVTDNVYWLNDHVLNSSSYIASNYPYHLVAYGWANPSEDVNTSPYLQPVSYYGGAPCTNSQTILLQQASVPFNYYLNLFNTTYGYSSLTSAITNSKACPAASPCSCTSPAQCSCYFLNGLLNNSTTQSIQPSWLQNGVYMPILAYPGFQRNLIRWYTPWGTWNLLNNTTDLFVRGNNQGVEIPAYQKQTSGPWYNYPLVLQTWNSNQFAAINLTGNALDPNSAIPLVVTNYPGNEAYFPSNIFLPQQAGLIPYFDNFNIYDGTGTLNTRTIDGFLGFRSPTINDATAFWGGYYANAQDPGGQANKPYLIGPAIFTNQNPVQYQLRLQHSNSIFAAQQPSTFQPFLYNVEYYLDTGNGYSLIGTLGYQWKAWSINSSGQWIMSNNNEVGTFVPFFTLNNTSYANSVVVATATSFSSSRVFSFSATQYSNQSNNLGGPVTYFTLTFTTTDPDTKFLAVMQPATSTSFVKAPVLSSAQIRPSPVIHLNYSQPATKGSGNYRYEATIEGHRVIAIKHNPSQMRFEVQVDKPVIPHTAKANVKVTDMNTGISDISDSILVKNF